MFLFLCEKKLILNSDWTRCAINVKTFASLHYVTGSDIFSLLEAWSRQQYLVSSALQTIFPLFPESWKSIP